MLIVFFDIKKSLHKEFVPKNNPFFHIIIAAFIELERIWETFKSTRSKMWQIKKDKNLHYNIAVAHHSILKCYLQTINSRLPQSA